MPAQQYLPGTLGLEPAPALEAGTRPLGKRDQARAVNLADARQFHHREGTRGCRAVFDRTDLTPRERLLAAFDVPPHPPVPLHRRRRSEQAAQEARQPHRGQGLQQRPVPRVPTTSRHPPDDPGEGGQQGRPPARRFTRRTATRLRRRPLQETQHRRAGDQQAQTVPGRGHSLRQARLRLPRNSHCGNRDHLAPLMTDRTRSAQAQGSGQPPRAVRAATPYPPVQWRARASDRYPGAATPACFQSAGSGS